MNIYGRIYCITNLVNGKRYIGKTIGSVHKRWSGHLRMNGQRTYLQNAVAKYGVANFLVSVIAFAKSEDELNAFEIDAINRLGTRSPHGYNLRAGGDGGELHQVTKEKIRNHKKHFWSDPENKRRMIKLFNEPERIRKRSIAASQRRHTDEERAKLSASLKRFYSDPVEMEKRREFGRRAGKSKGSRAAASARMKAIWADPILSAQMRNKMRGKRKTPMGTEARIRRSLIAKRLWKEGKIGRSFVTRSQQSVKP